MNRRIALAAMILASAFACWVGHAAMASSISRSGKIVLTGTVKIVSNIPQSVPLVGQAVVMMGAGTTGDVNQHVIRAPVALQRTGDTATGTVTLPYNWTYESGVNDSMQINFSVSVNLPSNPLARTAAIIAIPANGSVTTLTLPTSI